MVVLKFVSCVLIWSHNYISILLPVLKVALASSWRDLLAQEKDYILLKHSFRMTCDNVVLYNSLESELAFQ